MAYSTPGTYNVSVVINNPTYGSQTITRQVTVALITLTMNSFDNYVIANVSGIDLTTCQAFWVEKYCDYQPGIDEPCNLDFLPWQYTEVTDHGANPLFEWAYFGEVTPSFVSLHKFYFLVTDGRGHQYQSAIFQ